MNSSESRQKIMKILGEFGCYFLSIIRLAEKKTGKRLDAVEIFLLARDKNWISEDATVLDPARILEYMTAVNFSVTKEKADYQTSLSDSEILLFENGSYQHFVLGDGSGCVDYDPLGNSNTVAKGKLIAKRIFHRK